MSIAWIVTLACARERISMESVQIEQFAPGNPKAVSCVKWDVPGGTVDDC